MATTSTATRVALGTPDIRRYDGALRLTIPILNGGEATLSALRVDDVTLGSARTLSPPAWPLYLGDLGASNSTALAAWFSDQALTVGANLLLSDLVQESNGAMPMTCTAWWPVRVASGSRPMDPSARRWPSGVTRSTPCSMPTRAMRHRGSSRFQSFGRHSSGTLLR